MFEYKFLSVAGPHSDRTVPVGTERIQRRGDFWWRPIPGCQPKLSAGRLRAENWIVELTSYMLENAFFSCKGCCIANFLNSDEYFTMECASVWLVMYDCSFTLSIPGKPLKKGHTYILVSLLISEFQCCHPDVEENQSVALFTIKLYRSFCFEWEEFCIVLLLYLVDFLCYRFLLFFLLT